MGMFGANRKEKLKSQARERFSDSQMISPAGAGNHHPPRNPTGH
jgi:hypothetical protein